MSWSLRKDAERAESECRAYVAMGKGESDPDSRSELMNKAIDLGLFAKRTRAEIDRQKGGRS